MIAFLFLILIPFIPEDQSWQGNLYRILHHKATEIILFSLLILDVLFVIADILVELHICALGHSPVPHSLETAQTALKWCSIGILCVFCLEILLLMIVLRLRFFLHVFYVLDLLIIPTSIALDVVLHGIEVCRRCCVVREVPCFCVSFSFCSFHFGFAATVRVTRVVGQPPHSFAFVALCPFTARCAASLSLSLSLF